MTLNYQLNLLPPGFIPGPGTLVYVLQPGIKMSSQRYNRYNQ